MKSFFAFRLRRAAIVALLLSVSLAHGQSSDWILRNRRPGGFLWSIASRQVWASFGTLVAVGTQGRILSSTDGVVWNARPSGVTDWLVGVTFGGGRFIAVGDNGRILSSPDGVTWTIVPNVPTTARLNNVLYANDRFVAVGEGGTALVSTDGGTTWQVGSTGATGWLRGLAHLVTRSYLYAPYGGGTAGLGAIRGVGENAFVACGQGGKIIVSVDGVTWNEMRSGTTEDLEAVTGTYARGLYGVQGMNHAVAIGSSGVVRRYDAEIAYYYGNYMTGYNGPPPTLPAYADWTSGSLGVTSDVRLRGLGRKASSDYTAPILLASGERGVVLLEDRQENTGVEQNLVAAIYHGDKFYVVGEDEVILQQAASVFPARLGNLAARGPAGASRCTMIGGVAITGDAPKRVLVRGVGPTLGTFNVSGAMPQPTLVGYDATGHMVGTNSGWADDATVASAALSTGAFTLPAGSRDAALLLTLTPGNYTFHLNPAPGSAGGVALFEAYDADAPSATGPRLANISTRGFLGRDSETLIGGFVISGTSRNNVLVRGIGPTLRNYGVTDAAAECEIAVYRNAQLIASNDDWGANANATQLTLLFTQVGAFELASDSKDAALLLSNLTPGNYTVILTAAVSTTGSGMIEIYELP